MMYDIPLSSNGKAHGGLWSNTWGKGSLYAKLTVEFRMGRNYNFVSSNIVATMRWVFLQEVGAQPWCRPSTLPVFVWYVPLSRSGCIGN